MTQPYQQGSGFTGFNDPVPPEWPFAFSDPTPELVGSVPIVPGVIPIALPLTVGSFVVLGGPCRLFGWSLRESTGGAPCRIDLFSGGNNTGILLATVTLLANESNREWFPQFGIEANGIAAVVAAGAVTGTLYIFPEAGPA